MSTDVVATLRLCPHPLLLPKLLPMLHCLNSPMCLQVLHSISMPLTAVDLLLIVHRLLDDLLWLLPPGGITSSCAYTVHQMRCRQCVGLVQPVTAASMAMAASAAVALSISAAVKMEHPVATPSRLSIAAAVSLTTMPLRRLTDDRLVLATVPPHLNLVLDRTMSLSRGRSPLLATHYSFVSADLSC